MKDIPSNWWELLEKVKHTWGEPEEMDYYDGETKMVRWCTVCNAMLWDWGDPEKDAQYDSCRITTDWPGDDCPCLCTRRGYLIAHGIIEDPSNPQGGFMGAAMKQKRKSKAKLAKVGAVLVQGGEVMAEAFNGDYHNTYKELETIDENGQLISKPDILHAEEKIVAWCAATGHSTGGSTLYVTLAPCFRCARLILASGIKEVFYKDSWWDKNALTYLEENGVKVTKV